MKSQYRLANWLKWIGIALALSPLAVLISSGSIIEYLAPDDPVPQGAMVAVFLLLMWAIILLLPIGLLLIWIAHKRDIITGYKPEPVISNATREEYLEFIRVDLSNKYLSRDDQHKAFSEWKKKRSQPAVGGYGSPGAGSPSPQP
ncbi:MAG TPA: hypothetical protein PKE26_17140 [Kiritimatiellia bacterium]|nr:hypothetical protein [Kiritimatiellia bacterium]HMP00825.1 hypothetical protein [Kiritimatiellia bacterium]